MSEEKIPYLVENKERDTFIIYVKGTKPYLELQRKLEDCEQAGLTEHGIAIMYKEKIDKAIEILYDDNLCHVEKLQEIHKILGDKENE